MPEFTLPVLTTESTPEDRFAIIQAHLAQAYHGNSDIKLVKKPFSMRVGNTGKLGHVPDDHNYATETSLNRDIQDFTPFLGYINVLPRKHQKGGSLLIGSQGRQARTNDTRAGDPRRVGKPKDSKSNEYEMVKAHSDFMLHDDDIDAMSEFEDWADMYRAAFMETMGNDRIIIGWHGEEHASTSDMTANPLLQDVNKGWLTLLKERASSQVLTGGSVDGEIKIGKGEDYANLDALIQDLYQGIPLHRRTPGMAAMIAESVIGAAEGTYYTKQGNTPSEKQKIAQKATTGIYGGLEAVPAPYMPQTSIVITGLRQNGQGYSNLSIYWQKTSWRRKAEYKSELESSIDWNARREAYHIEDLNAIVALDVEKIIFTDTDPDTDVKTSNEIDRIPEHHWAEQ